MTDQITLKRIINEQREEIKTHYEEILKLRKAYSDLSDKVSTLYQWLDDNDKIGTIRREMAELFKFAYMEANFEDLRAKWSNISAREDAKRLYQTIQFQSSEKVEK